MTTLTISLPDSMKLFIEEQTSKGGFHSESEYVQALIQDAQLRAARQELEAKLLAGVRSPVSPLTPADWAELRRRVIERSPELGRP
jgi:antitoxin ParD1/3/4